MASRDVTTTSQAMQLCIFLEDQVHEGRARDWYVSTYIHATKYITRDRKRTSGCATPDCKPHGRDKNATAKSMDVGVSCYITYTAIQHRSSTGQVTAQYDRTAHLNRLANNTPGFLVLRLRVGSVISIEVEAFLASLALRKAWLVMGTSLGHRYETA